MRRNHLEQNSLKLYRKRMGFRQKHVAALLGHHDSSLLCIFEIGRRFPTLADALRLGIILRVPIEFLYPELYDRLREEIRRKEELGGSSAASSLKRTRHDDT